MLTPGEPLVFGSNLTALVLFDDESIVSPRPDAGFAFGINIALARSDVRPSAVFHSHVTFSFHSLPFRGPVGRAGARQGRSTLAGRGPAARSPAPPQGSPGSFQPIAAAPCQAFLQKSTLCPRPRAPGQLDALPLLIPAPRVPRPSAALTSELPTAPPAQRDHLSLCILAGAQSVSPGGDVGSPV